MEKPPWKSALKSLPNAQIQADFPEKLVFLAQLQFKQVYDILFSVKKQVFSAEIQLFRRKAQTEEEICVLAC
jgi:hypothetical protein